MSRRITLNIFSEASIKAAQKELMDYKRSLAAKCETFVRKLSEAGIETAQAVLTSGRDENAGFGKYIMFTTEVNPEKYGASAIMVASNTGLITAEWYISETETTTADISPLLMAEFGSGLLAQENPRGPEFNMGTGTFPGQTHAEDPAGWWFKSAADGEWHHSKGVKPLMPIDAAAQEMHKRITEIAKEVFGT